MLRHAPGDRRRRQREHVERLGRDQHRLELRRDQHGHQRRAEPAAGHQRDERGTTDADASATGEPPCGCPGGEIVCESFEPPFDPDALPWRIVVGVDSVDPQLVEDPVHCGAAALRTAVGQGDAFSAIDVVVGPAITAAGPHRVSLWIWIDPTCFDAHTRVVLAQFPRKNGIWYQFAIWIGLDRVELRLQNHASEVEAMPTSVSLATSQWLELELELDVTTAPPRASVALEGTTVLEDVEGPQLSGSADFTLAPAVTLGVYRDGTSFAQDCAPFYDDVRVYTP